MATATKLTTMKAIRINSYGGPGPCAKGCTKAGAIDPRGLDGVYAGVMDTMGGDALTRSMRVLKKGGIVVSTLDEPSAEDLDRYRVRAEHVVASSDSGQLIQIARLIDSGDVRPMVEMVMPLAEARRALEMSQADHVRGKIVLRIKE